MLPHGTGATAHRRPDPEGSGGRRPSHVCVGFGPRLLVGKPGPRLPVWVSELSLAESPTWVSAVVTMIVTFAFSWSW